MTEKRAETATPHLREAPEQQQQVEQRSSKFGISERRGACASTRRYLVTQKPSSQGLNAHCPEAAFSLPFDWHAATASHLARNRSAITTRASSLVSLLGDAKSSLGDAKSSLGDANSSLGDAKNSLGDAG